MSAHIGPKLFVPEDIVRERIRKASEARNFLRLDASKNSGRIGDVGIHCMRS
jgi:hypothetical protein